jgi:fructose-1,6-bisphosphatase/inositol monophosphatase family enzyme
VTATKPPQRARISAAGTLPRSCSPPGTFFVSLRLDGFFETGLKPWDFAAGALIAREGGADIRGAEMDRSRGELLVASAPSVTADLYRVLR